MIKEKIKRFRDRLIELRLIILEYNSNAKHNSESVLRELQGKILVISHSLEKGMGMKCVKTGFGQKKALTLSKYLLEYIRLSQDVNCFAFREGYSMLKRYINFQNDNCFEVKRVESQLVKISSLICGTTGDDSKTVGEIKCGYYNFDSDRLLINKELNVESFLKNRHSIRDYKNEMVSREVIEKVVSLANLSPSACNRQPCKVYCTSTEEETKYIDSLITGTNGFKGSIPNFAIITADRNLFSGLEQFQWYINGGIYTAYFVLALHSMGLGSIIMQWFAFYKTEKKIKKYFDICKNEAIVAIVGFGECAQQVKCLEAQRKDVSESLVYGNKEVFLNENKI